MDERDSNKRRQLPLSLSLSPAGSESPTKGQYCPAAHGVQPATLCVRSLGLKEPMGQGLGRAVPAGQ